jgi:hypothetical protein
MEMTVTAQGRSLDGESEEFESLSTVVCRLRGLRMNGRVFYSSFIIITNKTPIPTINDHPP